MVDISKLSFYSENNYLKRGFSGSAIVTIPSAGNAVTYTVDHNLGYIPFFIAAAKLTETDVIWSGYYVNVYTETNLTGVDLPPQLDFWCTTTQLVIRIRNGDGASAITGTREVYYAIYLDYGSV